MARYTVEAWQGKDILLDIDMHRKQWHITILSEDGLRLSSNRVAGTIVAVSKLSSRYGEAKQTCAVYEVGYFGFIESFKLADCLNKGLLESIHVPTCATVG